MGGQFWEKMLFADKIFNKLKISSVIPNYYFLFQFKIVTNFSNVKPGSESSGLLEKGLQRSYPVSVSIVVLFFDHFPIILIFLSVFIYNYNHNIIIIFRKNQTVTQKH